ncbi:hypothetical protein Acsp06_37380 [Actinomycetospora sp. NBRC 106375]|nr:hypothetical protein Acsp06_37380 [Actinomycetospora sp. NBRC 106375]
MIVIMTPAKRTHPIQAPERAGADTPFSVRGIEDPVIGVGICCSVMVSSRHTSDRCGGTVLPAPRPDLTRDG